MSIIFNNWYIINVKLNTGHSINESIYDICNNISASMACVLVNNKEDINLIKKDKAIWDNNINRILAQDVKYFHAPHITSYNENRKEYRNIYWADISGMDDPLGNINLNSYIIPLWVKFKEGTNVNKTTGITLNNFNQLFDNNEFKENKWYILPLYLPPGEEQKRYTIIDSVHLLNDKLNPKKVFVPTSNSSTLWNEISENDYNNYFIINNNTTDNNGLNCESIPAWIFLSENIIPIPDVNKITIIKQEDNIIIVLPKIDDLLENFYYYNYNNYLKSLEYKKIDENIAIQPLAISNLFTIEFTDSITNNYYTNNTIFMSNNNKYLDIINYDVNNNVLLNQDIFIAEKLIQKKYYIIQDYNNILPDISNVYINLDDGSGNYILYDAKNIYNNNGDQIIDICNLDVNKYI